MSAVHMAELERVASLAKSIVAPLAESWSRNARVTVRIESPQAERAGASEIASRIDGRYWVLPVEVSGVHSGATCLLIPRKLQPPGGQETDEQFSAMIDEFLASASDRLTAILGGPVSLDRLGLRDLPAGSVAGALVEALGAADLVAVHFAADVPDGGRGRERSGDLVVVFGGRLLKEFASAPAAAGETIARDEPPAAPAGPRSTTDVRSLLARAAGLHVAVSAEIGRKTMPLGELLALGRGSTIDLGTSVSQPLALRAGGRHIAFVDAVVVGGRTGVRVRGA